MIDSSLYKQFQQNIETIITPNICGRINRLALAVSGGSDSISMLMLATKWASDNDVRLVVMSVDHHVREQSKIENEYIAELSYKLEHDHYQLHFDPQDEFSNFQARAREARYKLMTDLCNKLDILIILTAHHQDDYIENYCMRLDKKSSNFGLSNSNINWYNNVAIARPLFNVSKQQLLEYLITNNIKWFEDQSNSSNKYQRNIIRKKLAKEGGARRDQIISEIAEVNQQVKDKLQPEFIACVAESIKIHEFGFATIDLSRFSGFSNEIKQQVISFILIIISGKDRSSRSSSIDIIMDLLRQTLDFTKTLHGCVVKKAGDNLIIYREFGRNIPASIDLNSGESWDSRFLFSNGDSGYHIGNLTAKNYCEIKQYLNLNKLKSLSLNNHIAILFTLPVVKILEKVIAIPHISYYDDRYLGGELRVTFSPKFISRFTHFC